MSKIDCIELFTELGRRLDNFGQDDRTRRIISQATAANTWFTERDILRAVDAIRRELLDEGQMRSWRANYPTTNTSKRVAIIMAGNIPLVGFFDLMCVLMAGHECHVKLSSKDLVLMRFIIDELKSIYASVAIYDYNKEEHYDMVIATGGEDANRYFEKHFHDTRRLIRGSRHSVALLDGSEGNAELTAMTDDITAYSGMGCRSVSMIFAPSNMILKDLHCSAVNEKLMRNIVAIRALYSMQDEEFIDCGGILLKEGNDFPTSLTTVTLCRYDNTEDVKRWICDNDTRIQCVVTRVAGIERSVEFGRAQYPTLQDYADGVDTMRFLLGD